MDAGGRAQTRKEWRNKRRIWAVYRRREVATKKWSGERARAAPGWEEGGYGKMGESRGEAGGMDAKGGGEKLKAEGGVGG